MRAWARGSRRSVEVDSSGEVPSWNRSGGDSVGDFDLSSSLARWVEGLAGEIGDVVRGEISAPEAIGEFTIVRRVGRGGMGSVYEAFHEKIGRRVAVKVLDPIDAADSEAAERSRARFRVETHAAGILNHSNIVPVFSVGEEGDRLYYAMPLIPGTDLSRIIKGMRRQAGLPDDDEEGETEVRPGTADGPVEKRPVATKERRRLHYEMTAWVGKQVADALAHAHEAGVIHRDVKPSNILVDHDGKPWVVDFGLARLRDSDGSVGASREMVGTLRYMAPEQAKVLEGKVDERSDVYSLGVTLYELATLHRAIPGSGQAAVIARLSVDGPKPPRRVDPYMPRDLETILLKATGRLPAERYQSAAELAVDLDRFLQGLSPLARRPTLLDRSWSRVKRHARAVAAATAATLVFAAVLVGVLAWSILTLQRMNDEVTKLLRREARRHVETLLSEAGQAVARWDHSGARGTLGKYRPPQPEIDERGFAWWCLQRLLAGGNDDYLTTHGATWDVGMGEGVVELKDVSPSGDLLLLKVGDEFVVWDVDQQRRRGTVVGEGIGVHGQFSPDGRHLWTVGADAKGHHRSVRFYETSRCELIDQLEAHDGRRARAIPMWVGKDRLLVNRGAKDGSEDLHDAEIWRIRELEKGGRSVERIAVHDDFQADATSGDGRYILGLRRRGPLGRRMVILETDGGHETATLAMPAEQLDDLPLGWMLRDGRVVLYRDKVEMLRFDSADGRLIDRLPTPGGFHSLGFTEKSQFLTIGTEMKAVRLRDPARDWADVIPPDQREGRAEAMTSADGRLVGITRAVSGLHGLVVSDTTTGLVVAEYPGSERIYRFAFGPGGRTIVFPQGRSLIYWKLPVPGRAHAVGHTDEAWGVAFHPGGGFFATGSDDSTERKNIKIWRSDTRKEVRGWRGHEGTVSALAFSPEGRYLLSGALCRSGNLRLWNWRAGTKVAEIPGHDDLVRTVAFAPDGRRFASAGRGKKILLWRLENGEVKSDGELPLDADETYALLYLPDGRTLVSVSDDRRLRVWDPATRKPKAKYLQSDEEAVFSALAYDSATGDVIGVDELGKTTVFDTTTWKPKNQWAADDQRLLTVAVDPKGRFVACAGLGGGINFHSLSTGAMLFEIPSSGCQVNRLTFSPDGSYLISTHHDGRVMVWDGRPMAREK